MQLLVYSTLFFLVSIFYIVIRSIKEKETEFKIEFIENLPDWGIITIKAIPAGLATLIILLERPNKSLLYFIWAGAFLLCLAGDVGIEKNLLLGIGLFGVAQILFILSFAGFIIEAGTSPDASFVTGLLIIAMTVYFVLFIRYLDSSERGLGKLRIPVIVYAVLLSLMFFSTTFLWITSGKGEGIVLALGGLLFVVSDSANGITRFHHKLPQSTLIITSTYHLSLLLLSLGVFVIPS